MKSLVSITLSFALLFQSSISNAEDNTGIEAIVNSCRESLTPTTGDVITSYLIVGAEITAGVVSLLLIRAGSGYKQPGSQDDLFAFTGSTTLVGITSYEFSQGSKNRAIIFGTSLFEEESFRNMLVEFASGQNGPYSSSILANCNNANKKRKAKLDCGSALDKFKSDILQKKSIFCNADEAVAEINKTISKD